MRSIACRTSSCVARSHFMTPTMCRGWAPTAGPIASSRASYHTPRRHCASSTSGEEGQQQQQGSASWTPQGVAQSIGTGLIMLAAGIVTINVNERRDARQTLLNEFCEKKIVSVDEMKPRPESVDVLNGKLVHAHGDVKADQPWPHDSHLGVEAPNTLRLRRKVEMFLWRETRTENSKTKEVSYTYSRVWSDHAQATSDGRNPSFPHFPSVEEAHAVRMWLGKTLSIPFSKYYLERLCGFRTISVKVTDKNLHEAAGLTMRPGNTMMYSTGKDPLKPEIGDMRITYEAVPEGPFSILGKVHRQNGFVPLTTRLNKSLVSEAPVVVPEDANKLAKHASGGNTTSLVIPEWLTEMVEEAVLKVAPLEFAFIEPGHHTKEETIADHHATCVEMTNQLSLVGIALCSIGGAMVSYPASALAGGAANLGGIFAGLGIGWTTRKEARNQVKAMKIAAPEIANDGKSDVTM